MMADQLIELADRWEKFGFSLLEEDVDATAEDERTASVVATAFFQCASELRRAVDVPGYDYDTPWSYDEFLETGLWLLDKD